MITEAQRKERRKHIGSSDIAAIFDKHPFLSAYECWQSKVYEMDDYEPGESAEIGNYLEDDIVDWVAKKYKVNAITDPDKLHYVCKDHPLFACNLDASIWGELSEYYGAIEAKYNGLPEEWGREDKEEIPDHFMLQVQHQLACTGFEYIIVGVWIASYGIDRRHYVIKRNQKIIDDIIRVGEWWWNKHVIPKVPPKDSPLPIPKTFSRIPKVEGKIVDISFDVWGKRETAQEALREAQKIKDACDSEVRAAMGDAQALRLPDGRYYGPHGKKQSYLVYKGTEGEK